jgi:shikimate kinase
MPEQRNIVLTGFMGIGKSTVSRDLARMTGLRAVELDDEVERAAGMSIKEIFEKHGEVRFRDMETEQIRRVSGGTGQVISTGGGAVMREENMEALRAGGVVVCLWAEVETILERTGRNSDRPLLNVEDPEAKVRELLSLREPYYKKADIIVHIEGKSPREVAEEILERTGWKN